jgi:4-carboxymuconolactone decarboxylase
MARIPYADIEKSPEKIREFFGKIRANGFEILNVHKMVAHSDSSVREFIRFGNKLITKPHLEPRFRELAILRIAQLHGAAYEWAHHVPIALQAGVSREQIKALDAWGASPHFSREEKTVLTYTEELAHDNQPADKTFDEASRFLDQPSLVELTLSIGYWCMVAKFLRTFRVDVEDSFKRQHAELLKDVGVV